MLSTSNHSYHSTDTPNALGSPPHEPLNRNSPLGDWFKWDHVGARCLERSQKAGYNNLGRRSNTMIQEFYYNQLCFEKMTDISRIIPRYLVILDWALLVKVRNRDMSEKKKVSRALQSLHESRH